MVQRRYFLLLVMAVVGAVWVLVGITGIDEATTPLLRAPGFLYGYRIGYALTASTSFVLLALWLLRGPPMNALVATGLGLLAGYLGGLGGDLAFNFVLGHPWDRIASVWGPHSQNRLMDVGFLFLVPLLSLSWLWTGVGAGLGAFVANLLWARSNRAHVHA